MSEPLSVAELAEMFQDIERTLTAVADRETVLDVLTTTAVETVPGAEYAGITWGREGKFATIAATADTVHRVDAIQYQLNSGPCVDAILDDTVFNAADLRTDPRWPTFGTTAHERTGITSMLSFRLYLEDDRDIVAGMNLYSHQPAAFGPTSQAIGMLLATHGALAVSQTEARQKAQHLQTALTNSREIGTAMGILMAMHKITRDQAFNLLRTASQQRHRKLADIAADVVDTGTLPA